MKKAVEENPPARPLVIPIFIPNAGCPHRCVFCNQSAVTGKAKQLPTAEMLRAEINRFLSHSLRERHPVEIAFFGGNFLGLEAPTIKELLDEASGYIEAGSADGLRFSTRPDTITRERIELLRDYPVTTVEIGAQSMSDAVLRSSKRGHTAANTVRALNLLKAAGYHTGIQLMVGLPNETEDDLALTGRVTVSLAPDYVRIYPTLVLAGSPLANWYRQGRFVPIGLDEAVRRSKMLYSLFQRAGIQVIRMGLQASDDLSHPSKVLSGPYHPAFGQMVLSAIFLEAVSRAIKEKGFREKRSLELRVNPNSESKLRGLKNRNLDGLKNQFNLVSLTVVKDAKLAAQEVGLNGLRINVLGD